MVTLRGKRGLTVSLVALGLASASALAGCAEGGSDTGTAPGEGVAPGATMEEYQEALADIDPITLRTQTPSPKGSVTGKPMEEYFAAVEEWSDGKITWEIAYSNAVAGPTENDDALVDGRLDFASVLPIYEPSEYPANAALIETGFISDQSGVVGTLQSNAWPNEVAFNTDAILQEFEEHDMVPLLPVYNSGVNALFCSEERTALDELKGMQSASGGTAQSKQIEALGGSAVSVPYPELFESLQRGVVDCTVSSLTVGVLGGFIPAAPQVTIDPDAGFSLAPGALAFSKATWDSLPLVARQLLWDRLDVFIGVNVKDKIWVNNADAAKQVHENGGQIREFAPDAEKALQDQNAELLEELRGTSALDGDRLVDDALAAADSWLNRVRELGYEDEVSYDEFDTWYTDGKIDVTEYTKAVFDEVFAPHRPS